MFYEHCKNKQVSHVLIVKKYISAAIMSKWMGLVNNTKNNTAIFKIALLIFKSKKKRKIKIKWNYDSGYRI